LKGTKVKKLVHLAKSISLKKINLSWCKQLTDECIRGFGVYPYPGGVGTPLDTSTVLDECGEDPFSSFLQWRGVAFH
jgi:hypothetical protein